MTETSGDNGLPIVELRYESLRELQEELGPFLAQEGLFLCDRCEFKPSDVVRFRIMLPGDFILVEGAGVVIWVRAQTEAGADEPAGAAIGFATLSEQGRELVEQMVQTHVESGGRPFDLTRLAGLETEPSGAGGEGPRRERRPEIRFNVRPDPVPVDAEPPAAAAADPDAGSDSSDQAPPLPFNDEPLERPTPPEVDEPGVEPEDEVPAPAAPTPEGEGGAAGEPSREAVAPAPETVEVLDEEAMVPESWPEPVDEPQAVAADPVAGEPAAEAEPLEPEPRIEEERGFGGALDEIDETEEDADDARLGGEDVSAGFAGVPEPPPGSEDDQEWSAVAEPDDEAEDVAEDPGPAFGDGVGESGRYLEDSLFGSLEQQAAASRRRWRLYAVLVVVIVGSAAWLGWAYLSGAWPFTIAAPSSAEGTVGTTDDPAGLAADISDEELEAVVSAAVDAVVQETSGGEPDHAVAPATGEEPADGAPETTATGRGDGGAVQDGGQATATAVSDIRWEPRNEGTVIVIRGNGSLDRGRISVDALPTPPRIVLRMARITEPYRPLELEVGTAEVRRVRFGHHPELKPPALWIVLDLADPEARLEGIDVAGDTARVLVAR
jgi:hypothetical protein